MSRISLSNTGSWKLKHDAQDVRGCKAVDAAGNTVGRVDAMIVDTDLERVTSIVLEDGQEFPAESIAIGEDGNVVYLEGVADDHDDESVTIYDDYGHVVERETVDFDDAHYDEHVSAFQNHHAAAYAGTSYDDYDPAYRYGFESAYDSSYRNRSYLDAEGDLRTGYGSRYADRDYDADRDAVQYGYSRAQAGDRY